MDRSDDAKENVQMLPMMKDKLPAEHQVIEVRLGKDEWQPATYRDGEFVDSYGMTLDRRKIATWRPANSSVVNQA